MENLENLPGEIKQWQQQAEAGQITYQQLAAEIQAAKARLDQAFLNDELPDEKYQTLTDSLTLTDLDGVTWTILGSETWRQRTPSGAWVEGSPKLDKPKNGLNLWPIVAGVLGLLVVGGVIWLILGDPLSPPATTEPAALAVASEPVREPTEETATEPTTQPGAELIEEPTTEPAVDPTTEPTVQLTEAPPVEPASEPTEEPTAEPTQPPAMEPTEEPTAEPTQPPVMEPTEEPTAEPTQPPAMEPTEPPVDISGVEPEATPYGTIAYAAFDSEERVYDLYLRRWPELEVVLQIDQASQPAIQRSSQTLLYRSWGSQLGLVKYDVAARTQVNFIDIIDAAHPNWAPTGDDYVYMANNAPDQKWHVYINNSDGLVPVEGEFDDAAFLDHNRLVFRGCGPTGCGLYTAGRDGSGLRQLTTGGSREHRNPAPSPDGTQIAFMSNANDNWDIYLIPTAATPDTVPRRLTTNPAPEGLPAWSPDGRWIAYVANENNRWFMNIIPADGSGDPQQIFELEGPSDGFVPAGSSGQAGWLHEQIAWFE